MAIVQEQRSSHRIMGADGVRAVAALGVIFSHLYQRLSMPMPSPRPERADWYVDAQAVFMHGAFGVSTFFVLSGMLLSYPFWMAYLTGAPMPSLRHYVRRRAARIVPGYYAALLVSFGLMFLVMPDAPHKAWRLIAGLTFTSGFHYVTFFPSAVDGPLWSISLEVFSYVLMPLALAGLFWLRRRRAVKAADGAVVRGTARGGLRYWLLVLVVVTALNAVVVATFTLSAKDRGWQYGDIGGAKEWMPGYNPLGFFGHFAIGILAAWAIAAWRTRRTADDGASGASRADSRWWWDLVAAAGLVAAAALIWADREPAEPSNLGWWLNQPYMFPLFAITMAVTLVGLAHSRILGRLADNRFFRYTATVSFGLYIWHYLLLYLFSSITDGRFQYGGIQSTGQHLAISGALLVIAYAIATVSWKFIEQPALRSKWANRT